MSNVFECVPPTINEKRVAISVMRNQGDTWDAFSPDVPGPWVSGQASAGRAYHMLRDRLKSGLNSPRPTANNICCPKVTFRQKFAPKNRCAQLPPPAHNPKNSAQPR